MRFAIRQVGTIKNIKIFKWHYQAKTYLQEHSSESLIGIVQQFVNKRWTDTINSEFYWNSREIK